MHLAPFEFGKLFQSGLRHRVRLSRYRQRDQHLVGMQFGIHETQVLGLEFLNGLQDARGDEQYPVVKAGDRFYGVEYDGRAGAQQGRRLPRYYSAVFQFYSETGTLRAVALFMTAGMTFRSLGLMSAFFMSSSILDTISSDAVPCFLFFRRS